MPDPLRRTDSEAVVHLPALLCELGIAHSRSDARRVIATGGLRIDDVVTTDQDTPLHGGEKIEVGKRKVWFL